MRNLNTYLQIVCFIYIPFHFFVLVFLLSKMYELINIHLIQHTYIVNIPCNLATLTLDL